MPYGFVDGCSNSLTPFLTAPMSTTCDHHRVTPSPKFEKIKMPSIDRVVELTYLFVANAHLVIE